MSSTLLREFIEQLLKEEGMFEEWLAPEVVNLLIQEYAVDGGGLGHLKWEYTDSLGART